MKILPYLVTLNKRPVKIVMSADWATAQREGASYYNKNFLSEGDTNVEWTKFDSQYIIPKFYEQYGISVNEDNEFIFDQDRYLTHGE